MKNLTRGRAMFLMFTFSLCGWYVHVAPAYCAAADTPQLLDELGVAPQQSAGETAAGDTSQSDVSPNGKPQTTDKANNDENDGPPPSAGDAADAAAEKGKATDKEEKDKEAKDKKHVILKGSFVAKRTQSVSIVPEEWKEWKIVSAVPHGTEVQQDDVLIEFDPYNLKLAVKNSEYDVQISRLSLSQAEKSLELLKRSTELSLAASEMAAHHASQDLDRYLEQEMDQDKESLAQSLKSTRNYLAYQEEELKQLRQMYEADDLTEQTEEIILRRTKDGVDRARFSVKRAEQSHDRSLEVNLPRRLRSMEQTMQSSELELNRAHATLPAKLEEEELKLEKERLSLRKAEERQERLVRDQELLTVTAPTSGVVYYGEAKHGKWSDPMTVAATLAPGSAAKANRVLMTVVKPRPLAVLAQVDEKDLRFVQPGTRGVAIPTAFPDRELNARITDVSTVPYGNGKFLAEIRISLQDDDETLMPGMTCEVKFDKL